MQPRLVMNEVQNINGMRISVLAFACLLALFASWILIAQALQPRSIIFATDPHSAALAFAQRDAALNAARAGLLRGDLWAEAAIAYGAWQQDISAPSSEEIQAVIETAIAYAPHDSRLWVLLAANDFQFERPKDKSLAALKMSYYTGPNAIAILPRRLLLATQSRAVDTDDELREFVRHDLRIVADYKSTLMPALVDAYKYASPSGRLLVEKALSEFDPNALAQIRAESGHR